MVYECSFVSSVRNTSVLEIITPQESVKVSRLRGQLNACLRVHVRVCMFTGCSPALVVSSALTVVISTKNV